jgi:Uma2 family endonuclease
MAAATLLTPSPNLQPPTTDIWVRATWDEFLTVSTQSEEDKTRCYYDNGWMRIETMGVGAGHSQDNTLIAQVVSLYGTIKGLSVKGLAVKGFTNGSFHREGEQECQPDMAFYLGDDIPNPFPPKTKDPVNVDRHGPPTLVIEIASTSLNDDLGRKRLLYERLGVREYWIIDVFGLAILAFAIENQGSRQIQTSQVLTDLPMSLIATALSRSQTEDDTAISRWFMQELSSID